MFKIPEDLPTHVRSMLRLLFSLCNSSDRILLMTTEEDHENCNHQDSIIIMIECRLCVWSDIDDDESNLTHTGYSRKATRTTAVVLTGPLVEKLGTTSLLIQSIVYAKVFL